MSLPPHLAFIMFNPRPGPGGGWVPSDIKPPQLSTLSFDYKHSLSEAKASRSADTITRKPTPRLPSSSPKASSSQHQSWSKPEETPQLRELFSKRYQPSPTD